MTAWETSFGSILSFTFLFPYLATGRYNKYPVDIADEYILPLVKALKQLETPSCDPNKLTSFIKVTKSFSKQTSYTNFTLPKIFLKIDRISLIKYW